jgi:DNA-binding CsgD family transcriptional regulator
MDPLRNPFAPGAGTPPPELAGRDQLVESARIAIGRIAAGRPAKSQMLLGLRGVGKTVLLNRIDAIARDCGFGTILLEAPEDMRLPEMLVPPLRQLLLRLSRGERMKAQTRSALRALRNFASVFKVSMGELEFGVEAERGIADSGNLAMDLTDLLVAVSEAAYESDSAAALLIDEVQYLQSEDLAALIVAIHRIRQRGLPLTFFGAGLPLLAALAGEAKSYAERLFDYPEVGPLEEHAARIALQEPVRREGAEFSDEALDVIVGMTQGYPYFLQEWGAHAWNIAGQPLISADDARRATDAAIRQLDKGFFRVRLDRLTPREKTYVRAMAELGPGPHRSGEIAAIMGITVHSAAPIRQALIRKGMVYSPAHGDTDFTVPMFDAFMKRSMPFDGA